MLKVRPLAKSLLEVAMVQARIDRLRRATLSGRVLVLAYHNIAPKGEEPVGDRSLHLPQRQFADQLDVLLETHTVVSLGSLTDRAEGKGRRWPRITLRRERPRAVITFDDAYRGAMTAGLDELAKRQLPATFFVAPAILGDRTMWWDAFADEREGALDAEFRATALAACRGAFDRVAALALRRGRSLFRAPAWARTATEEELARLAATKRISIGSHSWSHVNLAAVNDETLEEELTKPFDWLRTRYPSSFVPWLAWPYGLHSAAAAARLLKHRYQGGLLVSGGYFSRSQAAKPDATAPRMNVPSGMTKNAFRLRVSGLRQGK